MHFSISSPACKTIGNSNDCAYVNSYRRYVKDHAAPINLSWARDTRTTGIRIPLSSPQARYGCDQIDFLDTATCFELCPPPR